MLKIPEPILHLGLAVSLLAILLGAAGCASKSKSENNTLPGDYKAAPPMPTRTTSP